MDEKEFSNEYSIPANYTDSGKFFGGMLEPRNTVETGILLVILGYPQLMWMNVPIMVKIVIMTVTLLPTAIIGLMGVGGDSLLQCATHIVKFWLKRRKLHLRRIGHRHARTDKKRKTQASTKTRTKKAR